MNADRVIAQALAVAPELPGYQASAYMLELLEMLRTEGKEDRVTLSAATGHSVVIPDNIITTHSVWKDGDEIPQTLTEAEIVYPEDELPVALLDGESILTTEA